MKSYFSSSFKLGILGGGQLGRMLLSETQKWDIYTCVLDPSENAPCSSICNEFSQGDLMDYNTVYQFGKHVNLLTIEIEHVNIKALYQLEKEGVIVHPQPHVLENIQHKGLQKDFYTQHKIPTASYQRFETKEELEKASFEFPVVWKSAKFGYDGMGVKVIKTVEDIKKLPNIPCIVEKFISIENEFAVTVARNKSEELANYPVVEMEFHKEANQVEFVVCPAQIPQELAKKINTMALQVAHAYKHIGLLAIEFLQTKNGEILVNEVAPRPHNSGHYSIEASYTNQFEQHLRAILNLPLGKTDSILAGIMVNLVGEAGYIDEVIYKNLEKALVLEGVTPHIYGKKLTRAFRKMGHITVVNKDINTARKIAKEVKRIIQVIGKSQVSCD